jgi:hypothetical protein
MPNLAETSCPEDLEVKASERRLRVRYASDLPALCHRTDAEVHDVWLRGKIQNISVSGIRVLVNRPFMANSRVVIEPFQNKGIPSRTLEARVVYVDKHERAGWIMGCEFTGPLTQGEMKSLLQSE